MYILGMVLFVLLSWASGAEAACSPLTGLSSTCPAGSTSSDLQAAINGLSDGATITFAAGSHSWSSWTQFSTTKGVTIICISQGACNVTTSGTILGINGFSVVNSKLLRVSGFNFTTSNTGSGMFWFDAFNPGTYHATVSSVRIDHNTFNITQAGGTVFFCGDTQSNTYCYGVLDHNTINGSDAAILAFWIGQQDATPPASPSGTANNLFMEDNTLTVAHLSATSVPCMTDAWGGAGFVMRYNTVTNCLVPVHGIDHGGGPANWEVYGNHFIHNAGLPSSLGVDDGYRMVHHQGSGEMIAFNNTFKPKSTTHNASVLSGTANYVDTVCSGRPYPCSHQPGRDFAGNLRPLYGWNNRFTDTGGIVNLLAEASTTFVAPNRDIFIEPTSFNGTVGVGFGTLANRNTTCTSGVGYFATNQGAQGTLYRCSATNTWVEHYQPYTYPHPLVGGGGGGGDITAPSAPENVRVN